MYMDPAAVIQAQYEHARRADVLDQLEDETFSIGYDFKIDRWGRPTMMEYHVNGLPNDQFNYAGFADAHQDGSIADDVTLSGGSDFAEYLWENTHKDRTVTHPVTGKYTADLIDPEEDMDPDERMVLKPTFEACGRDVEVIEAKDAPRTGRWLGDSRQRERFVEGKPVFHDGEAYDACMRYVTNWTVKDGELQSEHLGGYWRTGEKALNDSDASLSEKHVCNLAQGGKAVTASYMNQHIAGRSAERMTWELFDHWVDDQLEDTATASPLTRPYGPANSPDQSSISV